MENLYQTSRAIKKYKYTSGMVLVMIMLFLSIVSLLAMNLLNTSLLETKMNNYYLCKAQAFYQAENNLEQYEQKILAGEKIASAEIIDAGICGVTFYRVFASVEYHGAQSNLQSTLAKVGDVSHCDPKPMIKSGRQSFLVCE